MADTHSLNDKTAIVAGAGGGSGRAIAVAFANGGARVACGDRNRKHAEETARLAGQGALAIACVVSSESETRAAVERAVSAFKQIHILVNGAAMSDPTATVLNLDLAAWNKVFAVNVGGAFLMSRWAIPHMAAA